LAVLTLRLNDGREIAKVAVALESGSDGPVLRVVQDAAGGLLPLACDGVIRMVDFGGCEYSSPLDEAGKEVRLDIDARIDTQAINTVVGHHLLDPIAEHVPHIIVLGSQIGKWYEATSKPTHFQACEIVARVIDAALLVVVLLVIERVHDGVVDGWTSASLHGVVCHVVRHDIQHEQHSSPVHSLDQVVEVVQSAEFWVK